MGENNLGIYEGCYVELRNGEVHGPVLSKMEPNDDILFSERNRDLNWWKDCGRSNRHREQESDIVRVLTDTETRNLWQSENGSLSINPPKATIPPHVLQAAMGAGIKADPAYEQFVNAILKAGFQAQYGIEFVGQPEPVSVTDELLEQVASVFGDKGFYEWGEVPQNRMRAAAECVISFFGRSANPKNESENRIQDSEKPKGGLSGNIADLPLSDITIVFTGATIMPRDTLKGIAESLGAKVSGSVHKHTTLVVYGPGAGSKLDKANEFSLPRMSEEAWLWVAGRLGYGKPEKVSPYGRITSKHVDIERKQPLFRIAPDLIAIALDEAEHRFSKTTITKQDLRSLQIKEIYDLINSEVSKGGAPAVNTTIPTAAQIDETIRQCVTEWRKTDNGTAFTPPSRYIAGAVHRMLVDRSPADTAWKERADKMEKALERIAKWEGEFPATGRTWDDGTEMSYSALFGSNGERDFMRGIANDALDL